MTQRTSAARSGRPDDDPPASERDLDYRPVIRSAISWYGAANCQQGGLEGSIILAQSVLELLSWVLLVEDLGLHSNSAFEKLSADARIRHLLTHCGIPLSVTPEVTSLASLASARSWDGPHALVKLRNWLVHPERKNRNEIDALDEEVWFDAWKLSLWYIELVLLHLFGYRGKYGNRLKHDRYVSEVEPVPWVGPAT